MSSLWIIFLVGIISQTLAQRFLQPYSRRNLNNIRNGAPASSNGQQSIPNNGGQLKITGLNSPNLSKFAAYNLQVQKAANVFPRLFDVSLSSEAVRENFYNEAVYFGLDNGLYELGSLPQLLGDAAANALPNLTPLEYFKVLSNTLELLLENAGIATNGNYQVLARINAKALEDAADALNVNDGRTALHAIIVGAGNFIRSLSLDTPENISFAIRTFADQFSKVPSTGGYQ